MKYIKTFNEALLPSQYRRYVKAFDKERYKELFDKFSHEYKSDKNKYRLYIPLVGQENETKKSIESFLQDNGYQLLDYVAGTCKFNSAKNPSKIGQVLTRFEKEKPECKQLMKLFIEDPKRKAGNSDNLLVCISRHPYDIAGADTDRNWTNCMTIAHPDSKKSIDIEKKLRDAKKQKSTLELEFNDYHFTKKGDKESFLKRIDKTESHYKELDNKIEKLTSEINFLEEELEKRHKHGDNSNYLIYDVLEGSLISFLIKSDDLDIKNPLANLNIKPFINQEDSNDYILVSDSKMYGQELPEFKETVDKFLEEVNGPNKTGMYCLNKKLYSDFIETKIKR